MSQYSIDKAADPIDQASNLEILHTDRSIAKARLGAKPEQVCINGVWETESCVDCGDGIEHERLEMGKVRCFSCQDLKERKARRGIL